MMITIVYKNDDAILDSIDLNFIENYIINNQKYIYNMKVENRNYMLIYDDGKKFLEDGMILNSFELHILKTYIRKKKLEKLNKIEK